MQYSLNIRYSEILLLRIFRIFAGRGAILWTDMNGVICRRIFTDLLLYFRLFLKGNGNRKKIC